MTGNSRAFGAQLRSKGHRQRAFVLAALPEGADGMKGSWSDAERKYVVGGNINRSNTDWDFVNKFPCEVLNKQC
jgi:hypothetical protein